MKGLRLKKKSIINQEEPDGRETFTREVSIFVVIFGFESHIWRMFNVCKSFSDNIKLYGHLYN